VQFSQDGFHTYTDVWPKILGTVCQIATLAFGRNSLQIRLDRTLVMSCGAQHGNQKIAIQHALGRKAVKRRGKARDPSNALDQRILVVRASPPHQSAIDIEENQALGFIHAPASEEQPSAI
jgi:hypothetical protein